jgi:hypothetical protein
MGGNRVQRSHFWAATALRGRGYETIGCPPGLVASRLFCACCDSRSPPDGFDIEVIDPAWKVLPDFVKPESALGHLPDGLFLRPALDSDTVQRAHGTSAICPMLTVDEDGGVLRIGGDLEEANYLLPFGVPRLHVDMFVRQSYPPDVVSVGIEGSEVHDRRDTMAIRCSVCSRFTLRRKGRTWLARAHSSTVIVARNRDPIFLPPG